MMSCLTVCISSGFDTATNSVREAKALLVIKGLPSLSLSLSFFPKKYKKHAAAMRLLPSTKEWFLTIR
jgi:hypothetical protein